MAEWKKVVVSGSVGELANHFNGIPTSNNWGTGLEGSYFNNFTNITFTSEILRFIAGLLSASAPDASPNTRTFSGISRTTSNNGTSTISGYVPQSYTAADITYIVNQGFATAGSTLYTGKTVYNNSGYTNVYSSTAGGSTTVSSSVDANLFGLGVLNSGNASNFFVSGGITWKYEPTNTGGVTATSQSENLLTANTFGTTSGLTIGKINTANPAVIPPAYQDGKFASVFSSGLFNGGISLTSVSSSGFYHISSSIRIASGSSTYGTTYSSVERFFWAPTSTVTIPTQTITFSNKVSGSVTAASGTLSGAPYITSATYFAATQVNGVFNPLYNSVSSNLAVMSEDGTSVTLASATSSGSSAVLSGANINTANAVFSSDSSTVRSTGTVPHETDIIKLSGSLTLTPTSGQKNIAVTGLSPTSFTVTTTAHNRSNSTTTDTQGILFHTPGQFNQPVASGSMGYFGFPTVTTETATSDAFTDERLRITLDDSILSFTGTAFNSGSRLGTKDLQVKAGWLVDPGGSRGYWYPSSFGEQYKFYTRRFKRTSSIASFTVNVGQTLVAWDDTSTANGVSMAIVFESAIAGSTSGGSALTRTRLFDPFYSVGAIESNIAGGTSGKNPFSAAVDLFGIRTGTVSGTTYTVSISNANYVYMNGGSFDEFYVILRYNGEPTTAVTTLSVS
jgi:hypothetical protein